MKKRSMLAFGIFLAVGLLLTVVTISSEGNAEASTNDVKFMGCPVSPEATYGGKDGWSTNVLKAKYSFNAVVFDGKTLKCYYGYAGIPKIIPVFEIQKPCPEGYTCETLGKEGNGFKLTRIR